MNSRTAKIFSTDLFYLIKWRISKSYWVQIGVCNRWWWLTIRNDHVAIVVLYGGSYIPLRTYSNIMYHSVGHAANGIMLPQIDFIECITILHFGSLVNISYVLYDLTMVIMIMKSYMNCLPLWRSHSVLVDPRSQRTLVAR